MEHSQSKGVLNLPRLGGPGKERQWQSLFLLVGACDV